MDCCSQPGLMPIEQAKRKLVDAVSLKTKVEDVTLENALGRVLAVDIKSPLNIPPFDNSAMDGYAIAADQLPSNKTLPLSHKVFAGDTRNLALEADHCVRIMTGAPLPPGCDAVEMQENTRVEGNSIIFEQAINKGKNVRLMGEDVKHGQVVITAQTRLNSSHIGLLATLGIDKVKVQSKLKVALLSSGDELVQPGNPLQHGQIYDSNRFAIRALLEKLPVDIIDFGVIADDKQLVAEAFISADQQADIVICSGGVSVGEADYTKLVLDEIGDIGFWKLAIKPGKPFAFGNLSDSYFIGLPGNPVSAYVTFYKLAMLVIAKATDWQYRGPLSLQAISLQDFRKSPGRTDYQRGFASINDKGELQVTSTGAQGSAIFTSLTQANCFVVLEQDRGKVNAGEIVNIEMFAEPIL
ncbi:molybdopterin molybdenumtransferase MoeA [Agarivorans sp. Toyoura001]|uniref:molybdopterin molybdotransferase MoeA n=1 Tax=Agarivorans sp. Toyoura001 TaxID=2283141 RepID=UPI0010D0E1B0|nr:molybdopterin molybdotransferase MoeA [Agarivorans sp. Toyoura001]GDY25718.1 molybdopterin molybdenumtransferase MoeA [Agarivorans sp. Toyoura001]